MLNKNLNSLIFLLKSHSVVVLWVIECNQAENITPCIEETTRERESKLRVYI